MRRLTALLSARRARVEGRRPKTYKEAVGIAFFKATYLTATAGITLVTCQHVLPPTLAMVK